MVKLAGYGRAGFVLNSVINREGVNAQVLDHVSPVKKCSFEQAGPVEFSHHHVEAQNEAKDVMAKVLEKPYDRWSILITFTASRMTMTIRSSQIKMSLGAKRGRALDLPRPWEIAEVGHGLDGNEVGELHGSKGRWQIKAPCWRIEGQHGNVGGQRFGRSKSPG